MNEANKFEIKEQNSNRDTNNFYVNTAVFDRKPVENQKSNFPLPPFLNNQTPPEPNYVGREEMRKTITEWYKNTNVRVGALIGWGGEGKSSLARKWFNELEENGIAPNGIFWWGFYRNTSLDRFLSSLLAYLAYGRDISEIKGTWEKVDKIKEYIHEGEYLIILDGFEEMQKGEETGAEFGVMAHREITDLLRFICDMKETKGFCLITTRFALTDIEKYKNTSYEELEIKSLEKEVARALFRKVGVIGNDNEFDEVISDYGGHALSLTLLSMYLVEDYNGDVHKAKEIPPFHTDNEAGGRAHGILLWYAERLSIEQLIFMKIFSLFRREIKEDDFNGVFKSSLETNVNIPLQKMKSFSFKRMVDNLCKRRLITKGENNTYTTHPLIKNYFESIYEQDGKRLTHKRIYEYIETYAPILPTTIEEMQPLFEQVFHGCAAEMYDNTFDKILRKKIHRYDEFYLVKKLGATDANLFLTRKFFPDGNLKLMPKVSNKNAQSLLVNEAAICFQNIGDLKNAIEIFSKAINMDMENTKGDNASIGYINLAEQLLKMGDLKLGIENGNRSFEISKANKNHQQIFLSEVCLGVINFHLGNSRDINIVFDKANKHQKKMTSNFSLFNFGNVLYSDILILNNKIFKAYEIAHNHLTVAKERKFINSISGCYRSLGTIERIRKNYSRAKEFIKYSYDHACISGVSSLKIQPVLGYGWLNIDLKNYEDAIKNGNEVLKLCDRTGFKLYEPEAELIIGKANLLLGVKEIALNYATTAYTKATGMGYRWKEGDAAHLLGEVYLAMEDKPNANVWLTKALACRTEILDPKAKETEELLGSFPPTAGAAR